MKFDQGAITQVEAISTGSLGLDIALGIGGLPRGRIIEVFGPESSGKTTLALHVVAEAQKNGGIAAYVHEHGADSGCGDNNWPKTFGFLAGWGYGRATLNGKPLYQDYEMHFMVTQGLRDRQTLRVDYPMQNKTRPGGETNPATQQIDFYIRSPQTNPKNRPNRQVFVHFFGMEITWK